MKKVFVAMSGGVDSSVSAALLKEEGYAVTGVFIKTWHPPFLECTWKEERRDAMDVCAQLGIPFQTFDLEDAYKREVVGYMLAEYAAGRTPNPDVMCNDKIKFGAFFRKAQDAGADCIATGHYARLQRKEASSTHQEPTVRLLAGVDADKDQSYFLWRVPHETFRHVLFPVGGYEKKEVRGIARRFGLSVAEKKDSQGVCFLGKMDMKEFLKRLIPVTPGQVLSENGDVIGVHDGALLYTLGERHGFTVTKKTPSDGPYYVVAKDVEHNTVTVSQRLKTHADFDVREVVLQNTNWISGAPEAEKTYAARCRYRQLLQECTVSAREDGTRVVFSQPQKSVAPGQSLVVYDGDVCLGGGSIVSSA